MAEVNKLKKRRWQFALLQLLLLPVLGGMLILMSHGSKSSMGENHASSAMSQQLLQTASADPGTGAPGRSFPKNYKVVGSVDDRYTMAVDPKTGQTVLHDALGGVGTNSTSVDGDRLTLAKSMIGLDQYAEQNKDNLKQDDYNWMKRMARMGMQMAFGTPGVPPSAQPPIDKALLSSFQEASAHPDKIAAFSKAVDLADLNSPPSPTSSLQTGAAANAANSTNLASNSAIWANTGAVSSAAMAATNYASVINTAVSPTLSVSNTGTVFSATTPVASADATLTASPTTVLSATLDLNVTGSSAGTSLSIKPVTTTTEATSTTTSEVTAVTTAVSPPATTTDTPTPARTTSVQDYYNALLGPVK